MNINCLNDDCLAIIFSMIPFKQLLIDRRVCKHWRESIGLSFNYYLFTFHQSVIYLFIFSLTDFYVSNERNFIYNQSINTSKTDQYFYKYQESVESLINLSLFEKCIQLMPKLLSITLNGY